jgi:hypothetical protein
MKCKTITEMMEQLEQLEKEEPVKISVTRAADIMRISVNSLRLGLMQGKFPFGAGCEGERNEYWISTKRFIKYMKAEDMNWPPPIIPRTSYPASSYIGTE